MDARVFLKHTHGYKSWAEGQVEYECWANQREPTLAQYIQEIDGVRPVYEHFVMSGRILDCGGGAGTVREFLSKDVEFVSTDPWLQAPFVKGPNQRQAYSCLSRSLNFIAACAEFQPFIANSFDWVHMRSMLDHVQVPDLVLLEVKRVLKTGGHLLIGLYVEGGRSGVISWERRIKNLFKAGLELVGINRWKDYHVWHPTYDGLLKLIRANGFQVKDTFWQPQWNDRVCYVSAIKTT